MRNSWRPVKFEEIIKANQKSKIQVKDAFDSEQYPFFTSGEKILKHPNFLVDKENIFMSTGGIAQVKYFRGRSSYSTDTFSFSCNNNFNVKFTYYLILSKINEIDYKFFIGSGLKHLQKELLNNNFYKIPPLPQQRKIANILSTCDEVIEKTEAAIAKYQALKQGMLHDLFTRGIDVKTGKLRPSYQDAPELYKESDLGLIPKDWEVKDLGDVGEVKMCKRIFSYQTKDEGDIPFYKIGTFGKRPDAFISTELYNEFKSKYSFPSKGSVLISASGTIGRLVIYNGAEEYFQDSNIVWIENNNKTISNNFLKEIFPSVKFQTEGGTIKRLYNNILKSGLFPCPPIKTEQPRIVEALNSSNLKLDAEQSTLTKY